jgi:hypothetical protein
MKQTASLSVSSFILQPSALFFLAALDSLLYGGWAVLRPGGLFVFLEMAPPHDAFVWRLLGLLVLAHVPCLILAALRPATFRGAVLVPLLGRLLLAGAWLWLLAGPIPAARPAVLALLAHDAAWPPLLALCLAAGTGTGRAGGVGPRPSLAEERDVG